MQHNLVLNSIHFELTSLVYFLDHELCLLNRVSFVWCNDFCNSNSFSNKQESLLGRVKCMYCNKRELFRLFQLLLLLHRLQYGAKCLVIVMWLSLLDDVAITYGAEFSEAVEQKQVAQEEAESRRGGLLLFGLRVKVSPLS
ncbi:hypothetical protein SASPL_157595 [Salvia splendens]|uniref:Uncharacterized protein n=1 Tax=Salvia splendens TaxID=180675 RepID=A0A8X8VUN4_SALSN|nr:hypothetical protein SASPL_157595 [Salvia splendens]